MTTWEDHNYFYENDYFVWVFYSSMTPAQRMAYEKSTCPCCEYEEWEGKAWEHWSYLYHDVDDYDHEWTVDDERESYRYWIETRIAERILGSAEKEES